MVSRLEIAMTHDPLLTVDEAAEYLRVSKGSIYQRVHKGELMPIRLGRLLRFRLSALEALISEIS
jgi:excisionase family DNA binding protein